MRGMISQPRYLPTFNYLQRIYQCDLFIILDDVQHQRRCVEHRNKILSEGNEVWLSIPIDRRKTSRPIIKDMVIQDDFIQEHYLKIQQAYSKCEFYDDGLYKRIYEVQSPNFVLFFKEALRNTFEFLDLKLPKIALSSSFGMLEAGSKKLGELCEKAGVKEYISGPNGRDYLNLGDFEKSKVQYHEFSFPSYKQNNPKFIPWICWLDGYFNEGKEFVRTQITNPMRLSND